MTKKEENVKFSRKESIKKFSSTTFSRFGLTDLYIIKMNERKKKFVSILDGMVVDD